MPRAAILAVLECFDMLDTAAVARQTADTDVRVLEERIERTAKQRFLKHHAFLQPMLGYQLFVAPPPPAARRSPPRADTPLRCAEPRNSLSNPGWRDRIRAMGALLPRQ